jgi:hypothetical protein
MSSERWLEKEEFREGLKGWRKSLELDIATMSVSGRGEAENDVV